MLHAVAGEETLVRTIRTSEQFTAFDAVGRMLAHSVFFERSGSGEFVRTLGTNEDWFVRAVHALEMRFHVTFTLEKLIALRARDRFLEKMLEFLVLVDLLSSGSFVVFADVTGERGGS